MLTIYHNPRCSKSRETLNIINEHHEKVNVVLYLEETPSIKDLEQLLDKLGLKPEDIIRKGEPEYKEHFKGKTLTSQQWLEAMVKYPKLIERPIVVKGDRAVLGRPPENVRSLLK